MDGWKWKTLIFNGWFGGKPHYFWKLPWIGKFFAILPMGGDMGFQGSIPTTDAPCNWHISATGRILNSQRPQRARTAQIFCHLAQGIFFWRVLVVWLHVAGKAYYDDEYIYILQYLERVSHLVIYIFISTWKLVFVCIYIYTYMRFYSQSMKCSEQSAWDCYWEGLLPKTFVEDFIRDLLWQCNNMNIERVFHYNFHMTKLLYAMSSNIHIYSHG